MAFDDQSWESPSCLAARAIGAIAMGLPEREDIEMVERLTREGMSLDERVNERGDTLLMFMAKAGRSGMVEWILDQGADPNLVNMSGRGALSCAAVFGQGEVVKILARVCSHDGEPPSESPLALAIHAGNLVGDGLGSLVEKAPDAVLSWTMGWLSEMSKPSQGDGLALRRCQMEWAMRERLAVSHAARTTGAASKTTRI